MNGTAKLERRQWVVEAPPHIVLRLKRVFPGVSRKARGTGAKVIRITDTLETCRDLAWFCERYPLSITPRDYLERRAAEHRDRSEAVTRILNAATPPKAFDLAYPAREYQRTAAELALASGGLLLADDVGLGKTVTAIAMLTDPRTRPALVVAPSHLQRQWAAEIRKFAPSLEVHVLKSATPYDYTRSGRSAQLALVKEHPDVLISSYHKLAGWTDALRGVVRSVVFDEVHDLRGGLKRDGKPIKKNVAAKALADAATFRLGMSATPIFNYGAEIYNVIGTLRPGLLGAKGEFRQEWCNDGDRLADPAAFGSYARDAGLMLRRTREDVGRELPALIRIPYEIDSDRAAIDAVDSPATELARLILADRDTEEARAAAFNASGQLDAMIRRATGVAKAPYVAEFVKMLVESGERVVLFGWHREVYSIWREKLAKYTPALYSGSESESQKNQAKEAFCKGRTPVLIVSLRSGAGLDGLQYSGCRTVVFGELDWSPAVHEQCAGRVHRDGQSDAVAAYYLIADSGSDPIVADVLGVKREQLDGLRDPAGPTGLERLETGGARVRALAEAYLRKAVA